MAAAARASGLPNVIMIGDCGTGKSTAVEKITGFTGLSSDAATSATHRQLKLGSLCGRFHIIDTPGENALEGALEDNVEVMKALNSGPVSLMLFTAKAQTRIEAVSKQVEDYLERFIDFSDLACILVTHMDVAGRKWNEEQIRTKLSNYHGRIKIIFSGRQTSPQQLCNDVRSMLAEPRNFDIDSSNFLQYFKICRKNMSILRAIKKYVSVYRQDVQGFQEQLTSGKWTEQDLPDQCFQFNTFMTNRISQLQTELANEFGWDFMTDVDENQTVDQQVGYVAHMSSQMRAELFKIRTILVQYHSNSEVNNLRKCNHCGCIWGKWEGCDGSTTCGQRPSTAKEWRNGQQASFRFHPGSSPYNVEKTGVARASGNTIGGTGAGCGRTIVWSTMAPVTSGPGWTLADLNGTADLSITASDVPSGTEKCRRAFESLFEEARQKSMAAPPTLRQQLIAAGA